MKAASRLYQSFTGEPGKWVDEYESPTGKDAVALAFGTLDLFSLGKDYWLDFRQHPNGKVKVAAGHDGHQLYVLGGPFLNMSILPGTKTRQGLDIGAVHAIAYTARRDGKLVSFLHDFRPRSRPRLILTKAGNLILAGGAYQFKDSGINDR